MGVRLGCQVGDGAAEGLGSAGGVLVWVSRAAGGVGLAVTGAPKGWQPARMRAARNMALIGVCLGIVFRF